MNWKYLFYLFVFFLSFSATAQQSQTKKIDWNIAGEEREALIYIPSNNSDKKHPVIFAFHGHGGTMQNIYKTRQFDKLWPEAIVVYPQGLKTPGLLTDPEGKRSGWVINDSTDNNRDLIFFDTMLQSLKKDYPIDEKRIYATGHSNGGAFVYYLWGKRAPIFAAFAPTAAAANKYIKLITPKPAFHLMGKNDPLVKPFMQKYTYEKVMKLNGCNTLGEQISPNITFYKGKNGNDFELYIHEGGHNYPVEANQAIIDFFKSKSL